MYLKSSLSLLLVRSCFPITLIKCLKGQKSQRSLFEGGVWLLWWWYTYIYKTGNSFAFFHKCNYNYMENTIAICNPCVSGWKDSFHLKPPSRENVNYLLSLKTENGASQDQHPPHRPHLRRPSLHLGQAEQLPEAGESINLMMASNPPTPLLITAKCSGTLAPALHSARRPWLDRRGHLVDCISSHLLN